MIVSPNYSSRGGRAVRLVVIHTAEGATTAQALGNYFAQASSQVSSHVGIDDITTIRYVDYAYECWAMLSANPISDQAELCGFARWTRDEWFQHRGMLDQAAAWIRERCLARGIPIRKLTPSQVAAGQAGVCGHWDWTLGTGEGTHTDPGAAFPWDYVINLAANLTPPASNTDDEESDMVDKIYLAASDPAVNGGKPLFPHGLYHDGAGNYVGIANDAERDNLIASGAKLCDGVSQATAAELLRLSRVGEDTPEQTHSV